jgi:hypothetical protein
MDPGLGLGSRDDVRPGSGLLQMVAVKPYVEHLGLSRGVHLSHKKGNT